MKDNYEVIIVGAGIQGLCAAHTFLTIDPSISILVIDNEASVGGTWAKRRIFDGLYTNNLQGFFEFSDFPILDAGCGIKPRGLISGEAAHEYLHKYAEYFGLLSHIQFNTKVVRATNNETELPKPWILDLEENNGKSSQVTCSKLLIATGQTSMPMYPSYPGINSLKIPAIHTVNFGSESNAILNNPAINRVMVIGGGKSAHDTVYRLISSGKKVTWLLRKSGRGGEWLAKPFAKLGPLSLWLEGLLMTRPLSWFGACPWSDGDGFGAARYFLHKTAVGRFITRNYFANMSQSTLDESGINKHEKTKELVPKETLQWYGGQAAILHYKPDFYDCVVEAEVDIVTGEVVTVDKDTFMLSDGRRIVSDAVIYATGYKFGPSLSILPEKNKPSWGVPVAAMSSSLETFRDLESRADVELFETFPELENSPKYPEREPELSPWRLWRFIAPPSQVMIGLRNLVFLTNVETYENMLKAELVSLWSYAYLYNELQVKPESTAAVMYEATLWSRFGKWRCPMGSQGKSGDTFHDNLPYYDTLLRDLGLRSWRKGYGLLGEIFGGWYELKDYRGIKEEWIASRKKVASGK